MARTPQQLTIDTGEQNVAVRLRRSVRAKRLQIRVGHDGAEIVLPKRLAVREAEEFLRQRSKWVLAKLSELRATRRNVDHEAFPPGNAVLLAGEWLAVRIARNGAEKRGHIRLVDGEVVIRLPNAAGACLHTLLERWLRRRARREITQCIARRSEEMDVRPAGLSIRDQRTRWASCSSAGNVSFSWRLICAPPDVLDYIVVHELAHLVHLNHSKRFWRIVESRCGDIGRFRTWLTERSWLIRQPIRLAPSAVFRPAAFPRSCPRQTRATHPAEAANGAAS